MKTLARHILLVIFLVLRVGMLMAQERSDLAEELSRYEALCEECLDMKARVVGGEKVTRKTVADMLRRFVSMNATLKARRSEMTVEQRRRFDALGVWFSTGEKPAVLSESGLQPISFLMPVPVMTYVDSPGVVAPTRVYSKTFNRWKFLDKYVLTDFSCPDISYGAMFGLSSPLWGGYVRTRFRNHISGLPVTTYECELDGTMFSGNKFWPSGRSEVSSIYLAGGILFPVKRWVALYAGAGYGERKLVWEDVGGLWALVSDWSASGIVAETGLLLSWRNLALSAGISTISFRTAAFTCGVGVRF